MNSEWLWITKEKCVPSCHPKPGFQLVHFVGMEWHSHTTE